MVKITAFSDSALQQFYNSLSMKQKNGMRLEYEIRINNEQITPRSADLTEFFSFQEFIYSDTDSVEIWVYKGTSRRYDKYVFELSQKPAVQEADFQSRLDEALGKLRMEFEFLELTKELKFAKEKSKELKDDNKELKERIKQLEAEAKNTSMVQGLMGVLKQSSLLDKFTGTTSLNGAEPNLGKTAEQSLLTGIPDSDVLNVLKGIQQQLGEDLFQTFLGTAFTIGQNPELIAEVRKLVDQSI